jgi:hypothetical protein
MMLRGNSAQAWLEKNYPKAIGASSSTDAALFISTARGFDVIATSPRTATFMRSVPATSIEMYHTAIKLSFGEGLRATLSELPNHACPLCGKADLHCERFVTKLPSVYTLSISWPATTSVELLRAVLESVSEILDVAQVEGNVKLGDNPPHQGNQNGSANLLLDDGIYARLSGMLCFRSTPGVAVDAMDYRAFFRVGELGWFSFDSESRQRRIGRSWREAAQSCLDGMFQPACLFYEVVDDRYFVDPIRDQDAFWGLKPPGLTVKGSSAGGGGGAGNGARVHVAATA